MLDNSLKQQLLFAKIHVLLLLLLISVLTTGCGQKGELVLPRDEKLLPKGVK